MFVGRFLFRIYCKSIAFFSLWLKKIYSGGCVCDNSSIKLFFSAERIGCSIAIVYSTVSSKMYASRPTQCSFFFSQIECKNFSDVCVKDVDGDYHTLAYPSQIQDPNFFRPLIYLYTLCDLDDGMCFDYFIFKLHFKSLWKQFWTKFFKTIWKVFNH